MKRKLAYLALGMAALAGVTTAEAGDYGPGIRVVGQGAAVPVPAPAPVPNMPALWYFRADLALGFPDDVSVTPRGFRLANGRFSPTSSMYKDKDDIYAGYGLGVGYRFSPFLRGDITVETRGQKQIKANDVNYVGVGGLQGSLSDSITARSVATLFNAYYDMNSYGWFVPYIGGGLGFSVNELVRATTVTETGGVGAQYFNGRETTRDVSLAAMGTAGVTIKVDTAISVDLNYRALYIGSAQTGAVLGSTVKVGDQLDHQFRAGVRFDIF